MWIDYLETRSCHVNKSFIILGLNAIKLLSFVNCLTPALSVTKLTIVIGMILVTLVLLESDLDDQQTQLWVSAKSYICDLSRSVSYSYI